MRTINKNKHKTVERQMYAYYTNKNRDKKARREIQEKIAERTYKEQREEANANS